MHAMASSPKHGLTRIELVVLAISGLIVFALLMPAVQSPRSASRRTQCANNLKQLSLAAINFETVHNRLPGLQELYTAKGSRGKLGSWAVALLPMLELQLVRDSWDDVTNQSRWEAEYIELRRGKQLRASVFYPDLPEFLCPSDTTKDGLTAPTSYLVNSGMYLRPDDPALGLSTFQNVNDASELGTLVQRPANGAFVNLLPDRVYDPEVSTDVAVFGTCQRGYGYQEFRDGLSSTILFAEGLGKRSWSDVSIADDRARYGLGVMWLYAGSQVQAGRPQPTAIPSLGNRDSRPTFSNAYLQSMHPGVVTCSMADGSVTNLSKDIDYVVYQALMTPRTAKSDMPNPDWVLKSADYQ